MSETRQSREIRDLLEKHVPATYRLALHFLGDHHSAQDIVQETMLRAWKHRKKLAKSESGKSWLLKIAANLCRDRLRKKRHLADQACSLVEQVESQSPSPQGQAIEQEHENIIQIAISELPENYRLVMHLHIVEKLSVGEIANVTCERVGTVKVRLSRARRKLEASLTKLGVLEKNTK